jgi:hypothetical protein
MPAKKAVFYSKKEKKPWIPGPPTCPPFHPLFRHACQESSILFKIRKRRNGFQLFQHVLPSSLSSGMLARQETFYSKEGKEAMDSSSSSMSSLPLSLPACLPRKQHSIQNKENKQWIPSPPACPPFLPLFRHACQESSILFKIRKRSNGFQFL